MHTIFKCEFKQLDDESFVVSICGDLNVEVHAASIEDCEEELFDILTEEYDEILPVIEYEVPPPSRGLPQGYNDSRFISLSTMARADILNAKELYEIDCDKCKFHFKKHRSSTPVKIDSCGAKSAILFTGLIATAILSEPLAKALSMDKLFELRPVEDECVNPKLKYVELLPNDNNLLVNGVKIVDSLNHFDERYDSICEECGLSSYAYLLRDKLAYFVNATEDALASNTFIVNREIVVRRKIFKSLKPALLRGITTTPLGIVLE